MWAPAYARVIFRIEAKRGFGRGRYKCRPSPYLNNIIETGLPLHQKAHRGESWVPVAEGAWRTIEGYEAMHLIRKGQIRWLATVT
jgi:hypothetical protein